ncbi:MAG: hypothetical protein PHU12_03645, partial [Candidatus Aenigmarchaeota archaeon]|nr:hypothetical protein [Candidatus Aenigmarchaeota archaeon]
MDIREAFSAAYGHSDEYFEHLGFPDFKVISVINGSLAKTGKYMKMELDTDEDFGAEAEEVEKPAKPKKRTCDSIFYLNLNPKNAPYRQRIIKKLHKKSGFDDNYSGRFREVDRGINIDSLKEM